MKTINTLEVFYNNIKVGTLAKLKDNRVAFEYDSSWLIKGFSISPLSLPLKKEVFIPKKMTFEGLFGVFDDSLPDGWGKLLVDRMLINQKINPHTISHLNRLAIVGNTGMGALTYKPEFTFNNIESKKDLDELANECKNILLTNYSKDLDQLFHMGGSSGGTRPKILTTIDNEDWIIKFPSSLDKDNIGEIEYRYSLCAKKCGIEMSETRLFPSKICNGYFGIKRFDRNNQKRVHMISVAALLETSHRIPNLDYDILMKLTLKLTNSYEEIEKLYRLMCFNVFAYNRDDHSKNFSFIYNEEKGSYQLSPAYDLTFSYSLNGEHATCVNGNRTNPTIDDLLTVANNIGFDYQKAKKIALDIQKIVNQDLGDIVTCPLRL